jgi:hypothetical protein
LFIFIGPLVLLCVGLVCVRFGILRAYSRPHYEFFRPEAALEL